MIKKVLKYLLIITSGFFLLIMLFLIFTQTPLFRKIVKIKFTEIAESKWNVDVKIDQLDGNFYSKLELSDVSISKDSITIVSFSSLNIRYNVLALLNKKIVADTILLKNPSFNIWQNRDSTWNFIELFSKNPPKDKDTLNEKLPFKFLINAKYVAIKNGSITATTFINLIPTTLTGLNFEVDGFYCTKQISANLHNLRFQTENPTLTVNELSTQFKMDDNLFEVDSLLLRTTGSNIKIDGKYGSLNNLDVSAEANPIDKNELAIFLPTLKLTSSPQVKTEFIAKNDTTNAQVELINGNQIIFVKTQFHSLKKALKNKSVKAPYIADILFKNVIPENWIEIKSTNSIINGELTLNGSHLLNYKLPINVDGNLLNSVVDDRVFSEFLVNAFYSNDRIETVIELQTGNTTASIEGYLSNISSLPAYNVSITTTGFNLTEFISEVDSTILNAHILASGEGFSSSTRNLKASVKLNESIVYKIPVSSADIEVRMDKNKILVDSLSMLLAGADISGVGNFELKTKHLSSDFRVVADSLSFLDNILKLPVDLEYISANAKIEGPISNLSLFGNAKIKNANGYSVKLEELESRFSGKLNKDSTIIKAKFMALKFETDPILWDTLKADLEYLNNEITANIKVNWNDTLETKIRTRVKLGDTVIVELPMLEAKTFFSHYYLADTLLSVEFIDSDLKFRNLWMKDYNQPKFSLKLDGDLSFKHSKNIQLSIDHLDLTPFNKLINLKDSISGVLTSNFSVTGTKQNPIIKGNINVENPGIGAMSISKITSQLNYSNKKSDVVFSLTDSTRSVEGNFSAPMEVYFDTTGLVFNSPEFFEANINIDSLHLKQQINTENAPIDISGIINMDIKASGSFNNPQFFGNLSVDQGYFSDPEYGLKYDDINFKVQLDGNKINLDTFLIKQENGFLTVNGNVEFDSTMIRGNITSSTLMADANSFFIAKNLNYEIKIDANTFLKKGKTNPEFGGTIEVIQSDFNLTELLSKGDNEIDYESEPLLLKAIYGKEDSITKITDITESKLKKTEDKSTFYKDLTGRIRLEIPRNTWLRSKDMSLELRGELDVVKSGLFLEIFGSIEINRGHYILYGKKLHINEGEIIFQGGEDIDPMLNFNATYTFRDSEKEKRELDLNVTGLLSDPTIEFFLDEEIVTESEAVSILIFGATVDEMGYSSQNGLVNSMGSSMVAQMVSAQLSKTVGSKFNLDMIEITATENWQSAAFVVGKYIGNDLFVTYQRGFGETEGDEITPETITLEYELNRLLFLRLQSGTSKTSGFDVILKFEQKIRD
ncbi:MAG: translocation/assembly module TamB domain-containing protein [Draconibacterium sp.]|nr:translocation/assembly module TamB domain-containing protein [Draconibacterium sp.]